MGRGVVNSETKEHLVVTRVGYHSVVSTRTLEPCKSVVGWLGQQRLPLSTLYEFPHGFLFSYWEDLVWSGVDNRSEFAGVDLDWGQRLEHLGCSFTHFLLLFGYHCWLIPVCLVLCHGSMIYLHEVIRLIEAHLLWLLQDSLWVAQLSIRLHLKWLILGRGGLVASFSSGAAGLSVCHS